MTTACHSISSSDVSTFGLASRQQFCQLRLLFHVVLTFEHWLAFMSLWMLNYGL